MFHDFNKSNRKYESIYKKFRTINDLKTLKILNHEEVCEKYLNQYSNYLFHIDTKYFILNLLMFIISHFSRCNYLFFINADCNYFI